MIESLIFGIIQGIAEWLPVSSEGAIILVKKAFFHDTSTLDIIIKQVLFLHLGTFLAALVYFRKDVYILWNALLNMKHAPEREKKVLLFLLTAMIISGLLGGTLITFLIYLEKALAGTTKWLILGVGGLLFITAFLQLRIKKGGVRQSTDLRLTDSIIVGIAQGFAVLPGLSRSGLTVAALLLRKITETEALRLSFLLSLPIVLAGNIILNFSMIGNFRLESLVGMLSAFIFGLLTIHILLKVAQKMQFGYFVLFFAILTIISAFL